MEKPNTGCWSWTVGARTTELPSPFLWLSIPLPVDCFGLIKVRYSEKATKIWKNVPLFFEDTKAKFAQVNSWTDFLRWEVLLIKKLKIEETKPNIFIPTLKLVYHLWGSAMLGLIFSISNFFTYKIAQGRKLVHEKTYLLAKTWLKVSNLKKVGDFLFKFCGLLTISEL